MILRGGEAPDPRTVTIPSVAVSGIVDPGTMQLGRPAYCHLSDGEPFHAVAYCSLNFMSGPLVLGMKVNQRPEFWMASPTARICPFSEFGDALCCGRAYPTTPPRTSMTAPTTSLRLRCMKSRSLMSAMPNLPLSPTGCHCHSRMNQIYL